MLRVILIATSVIALAVANAHSSETTNYSDDFNSGTLDAKWSFVNLAPNASGQTWSLTQNPGFLTMTTTGPTDLFSSTNTAPRMMEVAPSEDFTITTRVIASPDLAFEHAGILVFSSPTDWVRLIRDKRGDCVWLQTWDNVDGPYSPFTGSDMILRLSRQGSTYQASYSTNGGASFIAIGSMQGPAFPSSIGMTVVSTPPGNVFTAQFDYFNVSISGGVQSIPSLGGVGAILLALLMIVAVVVVGNRVG